jgi:cellulose synthase/poly-beta-1,6-N-acetylglucosamine synthase-like glycosyltransferase
VFDREAVLNVGGYLHDTVGEDMELVARLHRYHRDHDIPYDIRFMPEPVCWTEVPEDWEVLGRQRNRWQRGLADTLWRHKKMMFNPKYGTLGMVAMPFFTFFELLGPIFELTGFVYFFCVLALGNFNDTFVLLFFTFAILLGMILSISAVLAEEFTFRRYPSVKNVTVLVAHAFLENIGYRQIHTWWRFKGLWSYLKGDKEWGTMLRKGFGNDSSEQTKKKATREPGWLWKKIKRSRYWVVMGLIIMLLGMLIWSVVSDLF